MYKLHKLSTVPFKVTQFANGNLLWLNEHNSLNLKCLNEEDFTNRFNYLVQDNELFTEVEFNPSNTKIYHAERYGGIGIAGNGGGARAGNDDEGYQVKGCGKNPLAGSDTEQWYSYGGLSCLDATLEVVNSLLVNELTPYGCAEPLGIITTGLNTSYYVGINGGESIIGPGCILVREKLIRPAHYFPANNYKSLTSVVSNETLRVKKMVRDLLEVCGDENNVIQIFGKTLSKTAEQFAFARVARLAHGSVTTSNLSLDGRWLDLTNTMFTLSGKNYGYPYPAFNDYKIGIELIDSLVYFFCKYNKLNLSPEPFIDYYLNEFNSFVSFYSPYIFGLNTIMPAFKDNEESYDLVGNTVNDFLIRDDRELYGSPNDELDLALVNFVSNCFFSLIDKDDTFGLSPSFIQSFEIVLDSSYTYMENSVYSCVEEYTIASLAISLKRALYSTFFHNSRVEKYYRDLLLNYKFNSVRKSINTVESVLTWMFKGHENGKIILFENMDMSIIFDSKKSKFFKVEQGIETSIKGVDLNDYISKHESVFVINDWNISLALKVIICKICECKKLCELKM